MVSLKIRLRDALDRLFLGPLEISIGLLSTIFYREMLKEYTLLPLRSIINEDDPAVQRKLLRQWSQRKATESTYIQLAGGFLFTTVASCLQWPATQNGHWSASALFYSSILFALIAIILGSQQLHVMPIKWQSYPHGGPHEGSAMSDLLPQQSLVADEPLKRHETEMEASEKESLQTTVDLLRRTSKAGRPNKLQVFALQAPIMLLAMAVVAFLAGLCAVVFGPLSWKLAWSDNAKIAVLFGLAGLVCFFVFFWTVWMMQGLFSLPNVAHSFGIPARLARLRA